MSEKKCNLISYFNKINETNFNADYDFIRYRDANPDNP